MRAGLWLLLGLFILDTALGLAWECAHHHAAGKLFSNAWRNSPGVVAAGWVGPCFILIACVTVEGRFSPRAGVLRVPFVPPRS
jgi:hypothetical protein